MKKYIIPISLVITALFLSGCASTIHNIKRDYSLDPSSDKSIVFGKTSFDLGRLGGQYYVRFKNVESGRYYEIFARDGALMIFRKKKEPFNGFVENIQKQKGSSLNI